MHRALFAFAFFCLPSASGAVYYVDSAAGVDSQTGLSVSAPWKTLSRVAASSFAPGDFILLKRGSTWYEPFTAPSSGMPDVPITFGAYGSGSNPIIDGSTLGPHPSDLLSMSGKNDIVISCVQLRNGPMNGVNLYNSARITLRGLTVSSNRQAGIEVYNCNAVEIEGSEITGNGTDTTVSYDGIRVDGGGSELSSFVIRGCYIHDNLGGEGWNSDNGITLGHTGGTLAVLRCVRILGNELAFNGNPDQNQAGRGLSGTFTGDIVVSNNYVHDNASAGIYLGDEGVNVAITLSQNIFYNNALRQFGGFTTNHARAFHNAAFVDNGYYTAMGTEVGGSGTWEIKNNVFYYQSTSTDTYRGYIRINDQAQDANLQSDGNLFYSPGPNRWYKSNDTPLTFQQWQDFGFDLTGFNPQ